MKKILLTIWQLPQLLLGWILCIFWKMENSLMYKGVKIRINNSFPGGISLGDIIILNHYPTNAAYWAGVKHEYGHHLQSIYLGWLYLILIGLPSLVGNVYDRIFHKNWSYKESSKWYYNQPWEKWADKLGGVNREELLR